jgi:hypothetical protein
MGHKSRKKSRQKRSGFYGWQNQKSILRAGTDGNVSMQGSLSEKKKATMKCLLEGITAKESLQELPAILTAHYFVTELHFVSYCLL